MGVAHELVPFQTDHLQELRMDLEVDRAVYDMHSNLLHLPRPQDVVALVEFGTQLHEDGYGLPVLLGAHEGLDERRVLAYPVEADLDALHVGVLRGFVHEAHYGGERFVRVVQYPVAVPYGLEHVHAFGQFRRHIGLERLLLELGAIQSDELPEVAQSDDVGSVDLKVGYLQIPGEQLDHIGGHGGLHRHPHGESDVPVLEGFLDGGHEVARLIDRHLDIGVPGDSECVGAYDVQAREQGGYVLLEDVLQHHVLLAFGGGDADESRQRAERDLDPGIELVAVLVVHPHRDVQGVVRDERERVAHIQCERCEQGVNPLLVESGDPRLLIRCEVVHPADYDAGCRELFDQSFPASAVFGDQALDDV